MNSRAQRQQIELPFLLQMSNTPSEIHTDWKSAERVNAPFINNMMSPLYKKVVESEYKTTFDKDDNKYEIKDGALYRNDEKLFDVNNKKFVQTDVTSEYKQYSAFDFDDEGNLASLTENPDNSFTLSYKGNDIRIPPLYTVGRVICSRIRCFTDRAVTVIVYSSIDDNIHIYIHDGTRTFNRIIQWCTQLPKQTYTDNSTTKGIGTFSNLLPGKSIQSSSVSPLIQISMPIENTLAISLATNFAEQLNTKVEAYYTFIEDLTTGRYLDGPDVKPKVKEENTELTVTQWDNFTLSEKSRADWKATEMWRDEDGVWYSTVAPYDVLPHQNHIAPQNLNQKININGQEYDMYGQNFWTMTYTYTVDESAQSDKTYKFKMTVSNEDTESITKETDIVDKKAELEFTITDWYDTTGDINLDKVVIIDEDGEEHDFTGTSASAPVTTTTQSAKVGWVIGPNFFLDNGKIYSWYTFPTWNITGTTWTPEGNKLKVSTNVLNIVVESAELVSVDYDAKEFDFNSVEWHNIVDQSILPRNNCISVGQNFWSNSAMFSSDGMKTPKQLYEDKATEEFSNAKQFIAYSNSNTCDMRYYAGTFPNSDYTFVETATAGSADVAWYNTGGFRTTGLRGNWNILYYNAEDSVSDIQGLSWSETPDMMGTLVAPWNKIDSSFYIVFTEDFMIYRDTTGRIWKISIEEGNELFSLFDNNYVIVNTTSYWNCYDVVNYVKYHYATDYNNRTKLGIPRNQYEVSITSNRWVRRDSIISITAINSTYNSSKKPVVSLQTPVLAQSWLFNYQDEPKRYSFAYQCEAPDTSSDIQLIDVFTQGETEGSEISIGGSSVTGARYKYSILPLKIQSKIRDAQLVGVPYSENSTSYSPDIFAKYINGAGNNDFIDEQSSAYPVKYNNVSRPIFIYSLIGEVLNAQAFFVIQGQYYAVMNDKLYALSYYNGYIQNQDAVIDVRGMYFVGNTPEIAFFWSEKKKAFYSYTGDGILTQIFDATKYSLEKFSFKYFYDETVQSIWIPTTAGLLCFGVKNTFLVEDILDVEDVIFTADYTYIIQKDGYTVLKYFYEDDFEPIPIVLETSFYGVGNNEVSTIDRWQVTLFDERHPKIDVKLSVRSITDITVKAEDKTFHIGENDWDKWSHSILLSYSPKLIKGQGIRLYIETPSAIQKIVPHVADQNYSSTTKFQL